MNFLEQQLKAAGFYEYGLVDIGDIRFSQEVRKMCEANTCQKYGKTWACPPAVGTVDECAERIRAYEKMLVLTGKYDLEANGIFVNELAMSAQVKYNNGPNTVTYFGALLCNLEDLKRLYGMDPV